MIEDAENGMFDLIVTKAVSRFARNTLDSLMYSRKLFEVGVGIWFDTDGILNLDKDGELRLSIFSALAQDESEKNRKPFALVSRKPSNAVRYLGLTTCLVFGKKTESWKLMKRKPRPFESCLNCMPRINTA